MGLWNGEETLWAITLLKNIGILGEGGGKSVYSSLPLPQFSSFFISLSVVSEMWPVSCVLS